MSQQSECTPEVRFYFVWFSYRFPMRTAEEEGNNGDDSDSKVNVCLRLEYEQLGLTGNP